ncbi:MAG: peptidylprolyl isomerase [Cyclobacteriaceae bacterium]
MKINKHSVVSFDYTLKNEAGEVMDSSQGGQPLVYLHGVGGLIKGVEQALEGQVKGAKVQATVTPKDGYGEYNEKMVITVPKSNFQGTEKLVEGMQVQMENKKGKQVATVTEIKGSDVTLDANHPLAGMTLQFDMEVVDIRDATPEEIDHGHVHGPGGHHH